MYRAKFEKIKEWLSQNDFNAWKSQRPATWSVENSYLVACTICPASTYKMRTQYTRCNNTDCFKDGKQCPRRYKFNECQAEGKIVGYVAGEHSANTFKPKFHGLTRIAREIVEQLIGTYGNQPKQIWLKMSKSELKSKNLTSNRQF